MAFVPVKDEALSVTELDVPFVTVMVCDELVEPSLTVPKLRLVGLALTVPVLEPPVPVPETATCCGLLASLSVKVRVAARVPAAVGLKSMPMVQVEEAARLMPQLFWLIAKSAALVPANLMLLMLTAELPVLVRVTDFAPLVLPTATGPHVTEVGEAETLPVGLAEPVPEREVESAVEFSVMLNVAERAPVAAGEKTTAAVQLEDAARLVPQVVVETEKSPGSVPEKDGALRVTDVDVVFEIVMV